MAIRALIKETTTDFGALAHAIGTFEQCPMRSALDGTATTSLSDLSELSDLSDLSEDDVHAHLPAIEKTQPVLTTYHNGRLSAVPLPLPRRRIRQKPSSSSLSTTQHPPTVPVLNKSIRGRRTKPLPSIPPSAKIQPIVKPSNISLSLPLPPPPPAFQFTPTLGNSSQPPKKKPRKKAETEEQLAKLKAKKNAYRARKRRVQPRFHGLKDSWIKHMTAARVYVLEHFDITDMPVGPGGWRGSSSNVYEAPRTIGKAIAEGFVEFKWDGSFTAIFLDKNRRFIIMLRKKDSTAAGEARQARMTATLQREAANALLAGRMGQGPFHALRDGLVHNQGTHVPSRCANNQTNRHALQHIFEDNDFIHDARESDIALRMWNPALHQAMWDVKEALCSQPDTEHLTWPFKQSAYALTTVNFGPQTCCKTHRDHGDFAFLLSVLKAFGQYDYTKGGHIVLPTLRMAIQFPQGAEAYFPTARLPHANTLIAQHETRYSVTSYSGGGLFEWVYRGGLSKRGWSRYLRKHEKAQEEAQLDMDRPALFTDRFFPVWS